MPLTDVGNDPAAKTITLTAEFDAPVERAWQLYADPVSSSSGGTRPATRSRSPITTCPSAAWCALT